MNCVISRLWTFTIDVEKEPNYLSLLFNSSFEFILSDVHNHFNCRQHIHVLLKSDKVITLEEVSSFTDDIYSSPPVPYLGSEDSFIEYCVSLGNSFIMLG